MTVIRHCPTCGPISVVKPGEPGWPVGQPWRCARDGEPLEEVEYVPAEQLRGVVAAVEAALLDPPAKFEGHAQAAFARGWVEARRAALNALGGQ